MAPPSTSTSALSDVDVALALEAAKAGDDALALLGERRAPRAANVSAVYRWYEVEAGFGAKKREESSIARCKLCRQQGKLERKTCVRFSKSVTSNLWRHLKENHPDVYEKHAGEKKNVQMHRVLGGKKRGRKKKAPDVEDVAKKDTQAADEQAVTNAVAAKKVKKAEQDELLLGYSTGNGVSPAQHQGASRHTPAVAGVTSSFNPEKVREAIGYLCLYEMLPFELCSSHAFRNLMVECSGGVGGHIDDSNSFTLFAKEIGFGYAKKMAVEVKVRTVMQMKMTDFSHLMISEWHSSSCASRREATSAVSASSMSSSSTRNDSELAFLALFAVGLDQEFNPFRRCLHVSSIGHVGSKGSIATELAEDKDLKKALDRVSPCRYMPEVIAMEPPCSEYQSFCADHKLHFLESVPKVLQNIMIATINGVNISGTYCLGSNVVADAETSGSVGFQNRRLDMGEFVETSSAAGSSSDVFYGQPAVELSSSILEELPTSLTGHTYRDLLNKVMYLLAHFKKSPRSRRVLRTLAVEECSMSADSYERLFIDRLREMAISVSGIYTVLSVVGNMMSVLKKYFLMHKDGDSDFSKLIHLSSLSGYEWSRVRSLTVILKPFAEATAKLDGEQYVVSSLIVPSVFTLIEKLRGPHPVNPGVNGESPGKRSDTEATEGLPEDIEALRDLAFTNLSACFGHLFSVPDANWTMEKRQTFNLLWSATILDPRTRSFIIKGSLPQQDFWEVVKSEAANIAGTKSKDKENGNDLGESSIALEEDNGHLDGDGVNKSSDLWDDLQANLTSCAQEEMLLSSAKSSLELTKSSNLLEVEVSFFQEEGRIALRANPLEWWQNMRMKYPFLARLARYVLSIPCNVKVDDNPVLRDGGLVKRGPSQMSSTDLCDLLAASMNLHTEKNAHFEAASKQMWSTV
ncbi:unnamed protein product [Phytophthora lilii]|uniref:Unnamed protein product n=1 Tax=Phytophthora lilii TaxID=2077276 RepID=A0A9W6TDS6_9STRA|nr:unnamed protein product [Phytophthora lilii]